MKRMSAITLKYGKLKKSKRHTIKHHTKTKAVVVLLNQNGISGTIYMTEKLQGVEFKYSIVGLSDGKHGFHIHEYGDLTQGCTSACKHYNPLNKYHGSLTSKERHLGDLGNIVSTNQVAKGTIFAKSISLNFAKKHCIIGRMLVIHKDADDLGMGNNAESLKTGNAGERMTCGIIGLKK